MESLQHGYGNSHNQQQTQTQNQKQPQTATDTDTELKTSRNSHNQPQTQTQNHKQRGCFWFCVTAKVTMLMTLDTGSCQFDDFQKQKTNSSVGPFTHEG